MMNEIEFRAEMRRQCTENGSIAAWSRDHGLPVAYVSDVIHGRRPAGDRILAALGIERVTTYRRREDA